MWRSAGRTVAAVAAGAVLLVGCTSLSGGQKPGDVGPYVDDPLLHLDIDGLGPSEIVARTGNGQGGALTSPSVVIARYPVADATNQPEVLARVVVAARTEGTSFTTASCDPTDGLGLGSFGGYRVVAGVPTEVGVNGWTPGEILVSYTPPSPTGAAPTMPTETYPPSAGCSEQLLVAAGLAPA